MPDPTAIDQSANDLVLSIIRGPINPKDFFPVLATDSIEHAGFQMRAAIIGASHMFQFISQDIALCEVFACLQLDIAERSVIYGPLKNYPDEAITQSFGSLTYSFKACIEPWEQGVAQLELWEQKSRDFSKDSAFIGLAYEFPDTGTGRIPKTIVLVTTDVANKVVVNTVHSYPNEGNIVFSTTEINA